MGVNTLQTEGSSTIVSPKETPRGGNRGGGLASKGVDKTPSRLSITVERLPNSNCKRIRRVH